LRMMYRQCSAALRTRPRYVRRSEV
jgi:hypothetical protein